MTPTDTPLIVKTVGELDQERLTALRARLKLERRGRLGDAEDDLFGERFLTDDRQAGLLELLRTRDGWWFKVSDRGVAPDAATLADLEADITTAATDAGLTITNVRRT